MSRLTFARRGLVALAAAALGVTVITSPAVADASSNQLYTPPPQPGAEQQIAQLVAAGQTADAAAVRDMINTPQAVWVTGGVPDEQTRHDVQETVTKATLKGQIPVLVLYNLPFRDCAQYSAGGATNGVQYASFIRAVASGIGNRKAIVLLEPDSLGIIPWYQPLYGPMDWCKPTVEGTTNGLNKAGTAPAAPARGANSNDRFGLLKRAVATLKAANPGNKVYLDGTHSAWLGVGEAADRLLKAGVQQADGFFLNVSNYETTANNTLFGTWISDCIAFATNATEGGWRLGHTDWCSSQYSGPGAGYSAGNIAAVNAWYAGNLGSAVPTTHFVIDTSRNGNGPWAPTASYPDPQVWCNAPTAGLGLKPTLNTGVPLVDAYLWVKIPGASDGQCNRGIAGSTTDPEWGGIVDPAAGAWFPQMALTLVHNAHEG